MLDFISSCNTLFFAMAIKVVIPGLVLSGYSITEMKEVEKQPSEKE